MLLCRQIEIYEFNLVKDILDEHLLPMKSSVYCMSEIFCSLCENTIVNTLLLHISALIVGYFL